MSIKVSLRELLRNAEDVSISLYAFLEGLLEELEAQRPPQLDARIAKLTEECNSWERQCRNAEQGLAEVKERLETSRTINRSQEKRCLYAEQGLVETNLERGRLARKWGETDAKIARLRKELAEAKAEMERLRKQCDEWAEKAIAQANASTLFMVPNQEFEADADLGRMVREMRSDSSLHKQGDCYWMEWLGPMPQYPPGYQGAMGYQTTFCTPRTYDPGETLRAIQEVGDAEA